jgi:hypothetical protein
MILRDGGMARLGEPVSKVLKIAVKRAQRTALTSAPTPQVYPADSAAMTSPSDPATDGRASPARAGTAGWPDRALAEGVMKENR